MTTRILEMNVKNVGDLQDAVLNVVFSIVLPTTLTGPDGNVMNETAIGTAILTPPSNSSHFTSYADLTESQVVSWVESTTAYTKVLTEVQAEVLKTNTGSLLVKELPWST